MTVEHERFGARSSYFDRYPERKPSPKNTHPFKEESLQHLPDSAAPSSPLASSYNHKSSRHSWSDEDESEVAENPMGNIKYGPISMALCASDLVRAPLIYKGRDSTARGDMLYMQMGSTPANENKLEDEEAVNKQGSRRPSATSLFLSKALQSLNTTSIDRDSGPRHVSKQADDLQIEHYVDVCSSAPNLKRIPKASATGERYTGGPRWPSTENISALAGIPTTSQCFVPIVRDCQTSQKDANEEAGRVSLRIYARRTSSSRDDFADSANRHPVQHPFPEISHIDYNPPTKPKQVIKSIDEIIAEHSGADNSRFKEPSSTKFIINSAASARTTRVFAGNASSPAVSGGNNPSRNFDSITFKAHRRSTADSTRRLPESTPPLHFDASLRSQKSNKNVNYEAFISTNNLKVSANKRASLHPQGSRASETHPVERELARLLRSPKLTKIITLKRSPNCGVNVSLADVGKSDGHPVLVFLGLGCVRYLVALYEEMAEAFGLRLICLDRWGLGLTSEAADHRRGFDQWAEIVDEVVERMGLTSYSVLAHSAGGPYAIASAMKSPQCVSGSIHLLAPWISVSADSLSGAFKLIKYVPTGVLRSARAAEWKLRAWRLGKPPSIVHDPVGFDHRAYMVTSRSRSSDTSIAADVDDVRLAQESSRRPTAPTPSYAVDRVDVDGRPPSFRSHRSLMNFYRSGGGRSTEHIRTSRSIDLGTGPVTIPFNASSPRVSRCLGVSTGEGERDFSPSTVDVEEKCLSPVIIDSTSSGIRTSATLESYVIGSSESYLSRETCLSSSDVANGLLRASHSESLKGGTADLMVILDRSTTPSKFRYSDIRHKVKVWHGDQDDRISLSSINRLAKDIPNCELFVVQGGTHNLMTDGRVIIEVLESIASECCI